MARPTKYKPEILMPILSAMGNQGESKAEMAIQLGLSPRTFRSYEQQHDEFLQAVKGAVYRSQAWWERRGREATFNANGFSATSYIFNMKNRFPKDWADKRELDVKVDPFSDMIDRITAAKPQRIIVPENE